MTVRTRCDDGDCRGARRGWPCDAAAACRWLPEPREIVVVARQMAFYVGDGVTANPTIHAAPGERIRVTLVSQDPGFDHDFAVPAWRVNSAVLHGEGRDSTVIQVPDKPGVTTYVCSKHASMMKGIIEVSDPSAARVPEK